MAKYRVLPKTVHVSLLARLDKLGRVIVWAVLDQSRQSTICSPDNSQYLAKLVEVRNLAKLGNVEWAEYHNWSYLAKLGQVRELAKLGQSGPSTEYCL